MHKKNILVICKSFFPMNGPRSFRATELVRELAKQGHIVTVLTPRNSKIHDDFEVKYNVKILSLSTLFSPPENGGEMAFWKKLLLKALSLNNLTTKLSFPDILFLFKVPKTLRQLESFDLLISIAKPHAIHWGVAKALLNDATLTKKWIADCGDPFMGNPFEKPARIFEKFERLFCEKADVITVPVVGAVNSYYPEFREKIKVIPQGFDFAEDRLRLRPYKQNTIPTFAYAGAFYKNNRDPRKLLELLVTMEEPFKFIIYTSDTSLVSPFIERSNGKIELRKYIPRENLLAELSTMDFLLNVENVSKVQSPSKLIDYYLTGRPILSIENNQAPRSLIKEFLDKNYDHRVRFDDFNQYDIKNVATQFLDL